MPPPIKRPSASASLKRPAAAAAAAAAASSSSSSSSSGSPVTLEVYYEGKTCRIFNVTDKTAANIFERVAKQVGLAADQLEIQYEDKGNWIQYDGGSSQDPALQDIKTWTLKANRKDSGEPQPKKMRDSQDAPTNLLDLLTSRGRKKAQRLAEPAPLISGTFAIDTTLQREAAFKDLFSVWGRIFAATAQRERLPLVALPSAPGTGKTRFAWLAAAKGTLPKNTHSDPEWKRAFDALEEDAFKEGLRDAVGVTVTFNYKTDYLGPQEENDSDLVGVRMLYSYFSKDEEDFSKFHADLKERGWHRVTPKYAMEIIRVDIGPKRHVVLVVDEPMRILDVDSDLATSRRQLGRLLTSLGQIINVDSKVHILITSLSATMLIETMKTASGRPLHWVQHFELLGPLTVESLVNQYSGDVQALLKTQQFQAVLKECLGLPRLLETVIEVAKESCGRPELLCADIRSRVLTRYEAKTKYSNAAMRAATLVAAFSTKFGYVETVLRKQQVTEAELSGYLVRCQNSPAIPPLLLPVWLELENDTASTALLRHAVAIYTLSETSSGKAFAPRFERQLGYLYQLRSLVDTIQRSDQASGAFGDRTVQGLLGHFCVAREDSTSNLILEEVLPTKHTSQPEGMPQDPANMTPGTIYLPKSDEPGFDVALVEKTKTGERLLILIEAKLSLPNATTRLSVPTIADKLRKSLRRPEVKTHFDAGRLCFIVGGLQKLTSARRGSIEEQVAQKFADAEGAKVAERVLQSLVVLTLEWTRHLLTPTLASLPPFQ